MKISTNQLKDYINLKNINLKDLADKITNNGVNIEEISSNININNLIVGEVIECITHPNSDHLHICKVDTGKELLQIVCGAPNIKQGLKVIVALLGAVLPEFEIKKSRIRDVDSFGMLCSLKEIGLEDNSDGIYELPAESLIGESPFKYLNINDDIVYTLDLNPNRNDCLSHLGFAYEAGAALNIKVKTPDTSYRESNVSIKDNYQLNVETDKCSLIILKEIKNINIEESPKFIQDRLISVGLRPINNVVDISNYIMLEYGQPLHFYDADKLGNILKVRTSFENEMLLTLDNKERKLTKDDIVIANSERAVALAGIMGGITTEVDKNTKNIIIESAIFDPLTIRKTSIRLDLRSEASIRFEKGLNYEYTYEAVKRAAHLLEKYAGGIPSKDELIYDNIDKNLKKASVSLEKINSVLGVTLTNEDVINSLDRLGFEYTGNYNIIIPNRRMDVNIKEDLIEEIGRIYGFEKIVASKPIQELKQGIYSPRIKYRKEILNRLSSLGLSEVKTYTLLNEKLSNIYNYDEREPIKLNKPISNDRTHIRTSLIPSLLEVEEYNQFRGTENINIFEIANTYCKENNEYKENMKVSLLMEGNIVNNYWNNNLIKSDFYALKGIIENLFDYLKLTNRTKYIRSNINFLHPAVSSNILVDNEFVGFIGEIHPIISKRKIYVGELNLEKLLSKKVKKIKFIEPSKYPLVKRDVAFLVNKNIDSDEIVKDIVECDKELIKECYPFDEYKYEDKKSLAFTIKFESKEKTLTDDEIEKIFKDVINKITNKYNAILRDR